MRELERLREERRHALPPAEVGGLLCVAWIAGALWTASVAHPLSTEGVGDSGSALVREATTAPVAFALPEPPPSSDEPAPETRVAAAMRRPNPAYHLSLPPTPPRRALATAGDRAALGPQLRRGFEDDLARLSARLRRDLETAP